MGPGPLARAVPSPRALRLSLRPLESHASEQARRVLFRVELIYNRCGPHATSEGQQALVLVATSCARCQSKTNALKVYTTEDRESHPSLTTPTRTCSLRAAHRPCGIESQGSDCESYDGIRARLARCVSRGSCAPQGCSCSAEVCFSRLLRANGDVFLLCAWRCTGSCSG